jgi:hypothetical protein
MRTTVTIIGLSAVLASLNLIAQEPARPRTAGWLTKPSLEVCLVASRADEATKFFADGIGLAARDGSIWVLGLGTDPAHRLVRRVDEGAVSGIQTTRYESESCVGTDEVFIYYERKSPETGRGELRRCRTGISKEKP